MTADKGSRRNSSVLAKVPATIQSPSDASRTRIAGGTDHKMATAASAEANAAPAAATPIRPGTRAGNRWPAMPFTRNPTSGKKGIRKSTLIAPVP